MHRAANILAAWGATSICETMTEIQVIAGYSRVSQDAGVCMQVTPDYWHYVSWRASHRLFSSMLGIFATQSLLSAVGVGAQRSLPAAAAINWVLKDGLGRLGRLGVAAAFGQSFDADVKVRRLHPSWAGLHHV